MPIKGKTAKNLPTTPKNFSGFVSTFLSEIGVGSQKIEIPIEATAEMMSQFLIHVI